MNRKHRCCCGVMSIGNGLDFGSFRVENDGLFGWISGNQCDGYLSSRTLASQIVVCPLFAPGLDRPFGLPLQSTRDSHLGIRLYRVRNRGKMLFNREMEGTRVRALIEV